MVNELVSGVPAPPLRHLIERYTGYRTEGAEPGVHAGLPSRSLTFIVAFHDPLDVEMAQAGVADRREYWAMLAGLHTAPALVRHGGRQVGVQVALRPHAAPSLFGVAASALANGAVHLEEVVPRVASELVDRLSSATSWSARWGVLDDVLLALLDDRCSIDPGVDAAWSLLVRTQGAIGIEALSRELGWSRRHLTKRFSSAFGLPPKAVARVVRFERAQRLLRDTARPSLAAVAQTCGYADQAHMTREWTRLAGSPPTVWLARESIPILQDDPDGEPSV